MGGGAERAKGPKGRRAGIREVPQKCQVLFKWPLIISTLSIRPSQFRPHQFRPSRFFYGEDR